MQYEKINILIMLLGIVGSVLGFAFTIVFNNAVKRKEDDKKEIERQISALWKKHDEDVENMAIIKTQLDMLQGEHNVLSCNKKSNAG